MASVAQSYPTNNRIQQQSSFCDKDELRNSFALAMSAMYRTEVPQYGDLVRIVQEVNRKIIRNGDKAIEKERLDAERHGAIRLGTPYELQTIRRIFALLGMYPVDYYDLSAAGLPMHATAFRPITAEALSKNPFRIFTTLLRPELLKKEPRELALSLLSKRNIFSDELLRLTKLGEEQGGLYPHQGEVFIIEALHTFQWHSIASATYEDYQMLATEHPILADIACFNSAHINHLTPRTLDIQMAEAVMKQEGLATKSRIEGPPLRKHPVLLRQTSFLAVHEQISFPTRDSTGLVSGHHRARFGEIEQRGAAVTSKGRRLYDQILDKAFQQMGNKTTEQLQEEAYQQEFRDFPDDDWETLISQDLIYCKFHCSDNAPPHRKWSGLESAVPLTTLLHDGILVATPLTYEDFLPFSAAGIFRSNLQSAAPGKDDEPENEHREDKEGLETALGCSVLNSQELYKNIQTQSLRKCAEVLGIAEITL